MMLKSQNNDVAENAAPTINKIISASQTNYMPSLCYIYICSKC